MAGNFSEIESQGNISLKFGFLGLGMGGCAIAAECANKETQIKNNKYPYRAILVNTNSQDFNKIEIKNQGNVRKIQLEGYEQGAARNPQVGEEAFVKHETKIFEAVKQEFEDRDFIWITCGLGGGTGTGALLKAIEMLYEHDYNFGLLLTLPRDAEALKVLENATSRIRSIAMNQEAFGSIVLIDNAKLYRKFEEENPSALANEYTSYSNKYIADALHEINLVTSSFTPFSDTHFDASEFAQVINTPGVLSLAKLELKSNQLDTENPLGYLTQLGNALEKGVLYDTEREELESAKKSALSIVTSPLRAGRLYNFSFLNQMENFLKERTPYVDERPIAPYVNKHTTKKEEDIVKFYSVVAGLPLPKRVSDIIDEITRIKEEREQANSKKSNAVLNKLFAFDDSVQEEKPKKKKLNFGAEPEVEVADDSQPAKKKLSF
ncbi:plasmid replication protein RepX [Bacillus thuringiensis serovar pingluonsis]|uniref:Plasmid replication protein RepX n=2 Tax=Bacillus thuringiensis TaxID=1428 RepID=A0A243CWP3_BACTU|nr:MULTISPECIES: plasmid replication protein RepX [Bacillus cereus group]MCU5032253.1 plasmid replication protein RepX [Bacillus cereus]MRA75499.1 plasmid replication protein RepX [Bacillus thuringiensis]EEM85999.1 Plasmid replication protein repX [Bacillus thuringiensis serovar pulsiensis BGSC 4CC1]MEB9685730.1 plasmid replication protein RepX [Bacillus anthracis]MRA93988.1 plasmid replication protein RepX [Bacillus thuringiensis]